MIEKMDGENVDSISNEASEPRAANSKFKRLKLVREVIRVSSNLRAGNGCFDTFGSRSGSNSHTD